MPGLPVADGRWKVFRLLVLPGFYQQIMVQVNQPILKATILEPRLGPPQSLKASCEQHQVAPRRLFLTGTPDGFQKVCYALDCCDPEATVHTAHCRHLYCLL